MTVRRLILGELETNCYVVWDDAKRCTVIDPADDADTILALVDEQGLTVERVVLTHAHFDHMLAAEVVCCQTKAPLLVGRADLAALSDPIRNLSGWFTPNQALTIDGGKPLQEGDTLTVGSLSFTVLETPGHTPGCICLLGEGVLFSGDTLFRNSIGRLDFPGGNEEDMLLSLKRLMALPADTKVYSGHGPATTIGCEIQRNPFLQ